MVTDKTMSMEAQPPDDEQDWYDVDEDGKPFLKLGWVVFDSDGSTKRLGECPQCREWFELSGGAYTDEEVCENCDEDNEVDLVCNEEPNLN